MAGTSMLKVSPWPSPTERLHSVRSSTSVSNLVSSAGGSSFLLLLLQPTARTARASSAAFFQRITSRIPFCQVVQLHLQTANGGIFGQRILGFLIGGVRIVIATQLHQQVALEFLATGEEGVLDLGVEQFQCIVGLVLRRQHASQALTRQFA